MTHAQFEVLSNQAVAACAVVYFLAFLAHMAQWAAGRRVAATPARTPAAASVGARTEDETPGGVGTLTREGPDAGAAQPDEGGRMDLFCRVGVALTMVAAVVHLVAVVARGLAADPVRVPWSNMYEFTLTATWVVVVAYLLLFRRFSLSWLAPVLTGFVLTCLMADVLLLYTPVTKLRDALQSPWLVVHVIAAIIATGAFTIAGMASALYLIKNRWPHTRPGGFIDRLPSLEVLDQVAYRTSAFGFPVWTFAALIAGPIWAQYAWGRYWGWDPKEVWAFITWVIFAAYLHARATAGWKGKAAAVIALVGLASLWFNFIGINFFFGSGSMHSYA